jgi:hypothetical protein
MPVRMPDTQNPYLPIAIGFHLLALPLLVAIFLADSRAGGWTNGIAAGVMILCGLLLQRRPR